MGASDDIDLEGAAPRPTPVELSQLVREEVRAVVREQMLGPSSEPAPPSYDSSASLLATDAATRLDEQSDDDETQRNSDEAPVPNLLSGIPNWLYAVLTWLPPLAVIFSITITSASGADPLSLAPVSLVLAIGLWIMVTLPFIIMEIVPKRKRAATDGETQDSAPQSDKKEAQDNIGIFVSYFFTITYLLSVLIMWFWFTKHHGSLFAAFQMANKFSEKVDVGDALSKLTACLDDAAQGRKVLIADVSHCLENMGVKS